jgi:hypothetical protein
VERVDPIFYGDPLTAARKALGLKCYSLPPHRSPSAITSGALPLSSHLLRISLKKAAIPSQPWPSLNDEIPAVLALGLATRPHPLQLHPEQPQDRPAKVLRAFRHMAFPTREESHPLARGMSPVATVPGGPSGFEDSPLSALMRKQATCGVLEGRLDYSMMINDKFPVQNEIHD